MCCAVLSEIYDPTLLKTDVQQYLCACGPPKIGLNNVGVQEQASGWNLTRTVEPPMRSAHRYILQPIYWQDCSLGSAVAFTSKRLLKGTACSHHHHYPPKSNQQQSLHAYIYIYRP